MTQSKHTKRALLASVMSVAVCCAMPIALSSFLQYAAIADVNAAFATCTDAMNVITQSYPFSGGYVTPAATQLQAGAETER